MRTIFLICLITLVAFSCNTNNQKPQKVDNKDLEEELLSAIEDRFYSWRDNDFDTHLATYHEDWKRWDRKLDTLLRKKDVGKFWEDGKKNEEPLDMEIELVDYYILGDGNVAIVHYKSKESFRWIGPDIPPYLESNSDYEGVARWSDVMVRENDKWFCIGGHRDRSQSPNSLIKLN